MSLQMTLMDCGVDVTALDPIFNTLRERLAQHTTQESIPHLRFMITIEERALRNLRGEHRHRSELRLDMYRRRLDTILKGAS